MATNSDGQVRIEIDTNAKEVQQELQKTGSELNKTGKAAQSMSGDFDALEKNIQDNITLLREMALAGNSDTEAFKKLAEQTKEYQKQINAANSEVNKATGGINTQGGMFDSLKGKITGLVGAYVGIRGAVAAFNYVMSSVEAYRTQEIAIASLNTSLKNAGVYTNQYAAQIQALASEIQSYSNYGDEAIIKAQALGQSFAGQVPITEEATKAVVDFAAATGMDLEQAFTLFGKSVGSSTNALSRYGIELKKGMTDSQKLESITHQLEQRFTGSAKEIANASVQMKNAFSDLSEEIGKTFNPAIESAQRVLKGLAERITENIKLARLLKTENANLGNLAATIDKRSAVQGELYKLEEKYKVGGTTTDYYNRKKGELQQEIKFLDQWAVVYARRNKEQEEANKNLKPNKFNDDLGGYSSVSSGGGRVSSKAVAQAKDEYEKLQQAVASAKREIELMAIAHGTDSEQVQKAFVNYRELSTQLANIDGLFTTEKQNITANASAYQELSNKISELKSKMLDLITQGDTSSDYFNSLKEQYTAAVNEMETVNKTFSDSFKTSFTDVTRSIGSSLTSAIITPLSEGESYLQRFGSIGLSIVNQIANQAIQALLQQISLEQVILGIKTAQKAVSSYFGFAKGGVFENGNVIPFATGGVVTQPTTFPIANGSTGLMGEAGAEAIMPLKRNAQGKLGVEASGVTSNVNIYNYSNSQIETRKRPNGDTDVFIKRVNAALSSERTQQGFSNALSRNNNVGVQAS